MKEGENAERAERGTYTSSCQEEQKVRGESSSRTKKKTCCGVLPQGKRYVGERLNLRKSEATSEREGLTKETYVCSRNW